MKAYLGVLLFVDLDTNVGEFGTKFWFVFGHSVWLEFDWWDGETEWPKLAELLVEENEWEFEGTETFLEGLIEFEERTSAKENLLKSTCYRRVGWTICIGKVVSVGEFCKSISDIYTSLWRQTFVTLMRITVTNKNALCWHTSI